MVTVVEKKDVLLILLCDWEHTVFTVFRSGLLFFGVVMVQLGTSYEKGQNI